MGIEFGIPYYGAWLAGTAFALVCLYVSLNVMERQRQGRIARFVEAKLAPRLLAGLDASARRPLAWFTLLGVGALAVAVAQPHWGQSLREITKHSRDFIILLDTSESMRAKSPLPNRMERAKQKIALLLDKAPADRFALVAFSGAAQLQSPLTLDHRYFRTVLDSMDTDVISEEGTNIAAAMQAAIKVFAKEDEDAGVSNRASRAILLISDGEQLEGDGIEAAREASNYARVFVLGIGDPDGAEVMMPDFMARYLKDGRRGTSEHDPTKPHRSALDEGTLKQIALEGGGAYARSVADTWDIDELYSRFATLSTRDTSSELRLRLVNRYQWPLAAAIAAFAAEGVWLAIMPWWRRWRERKQRAAGVDGAEYA
ncbi:MAG: VWA domain-containing protein [Candidatus Hydrogenedentes bacterium]|nr:VWA domain-containing protein [Candidatus Hydrogenedentota bacterium]